MESRPQTSATWILGFDGSCRKCNQLAQQLVELSDGRLTAQSLRSAAVQSWREQALGPDAPWVPTLFTVNGSNVQAWTGPGLVIRLGRLVGIRNLWQIANSIGDLINPTAAPESPGRRELVRKGLVGSATAIALLSGGHRLSRNTTLAQDVESSSSGRQSQWSGKRLTGDARDRMLRLAENNRHFTIIRDHFDQDGGRTWRIHDRQAFRVLYDNKRERDAYWITYKEASEQTWVHVMYVQQDNGREMASGYLWRGERAEFTDRYHVQNGNLRRDNNGRVEGSDFEANAYQIPWPDDVDQVVCPVATYGPCVAGTGAVAAACYIPLVNVFTCVQGSIVVAGCYTAVAPIANDACKTIDGS